MDNQFARAFGLAFLFASIVSSAGTSYAIQDDASAQSQTVSDEILIPTPAPPLAGDTVLTRLAFGSCADEEKPQPIWKAVSSVSPQLFLFTGDNVYADINQGVWVNEPSMDALQFAYNTLATNADFLSVYGKIPMHTTWDDHDYGKNDGGSDFPIKEQAKDYMLDFFSVAQDDPVRSRAGAYYSRMYGPEGQRVQLIMLDTRFFRSALTKTDERNAPGKERYVPSEDPDQTMLGDEQWAWLEAELQKPADLRIMVSSIQVLADTHGWEAWRTMPQERQRLYSLINNAKGGRVVIVSGDRHVGGIYRRADLIDYPLYEITSSSLNLPFNPSKEIRNEWDKNQIGLLYGPENFGTMDIDWENSLLSIDLRDINGDSVRSVTIPIAEITRPESGEKTES
ncbi:hypothetical protein GCM10017044_12020 [Kordiimonas sediminis]|uniref:PhoD-like phosphatase metallophosphatase domain-containing protein n=1 Tax=Kordiimonas sediminis TaxID=1735581 RepID=A0A919AQA8_9PROT|nr:alkaline phosphatase D family protein [Kordiimonas sediminis]GHF19061.1 hypothetical protein GCM10017044_12020 [Kordiimonas sediminis]